MKQNPKIITKIKEWQPDTLLIGFKLLVGVSKEHLLDVARRSLVKNQAGYILVNDLEEVSGSRHHGYLVGADGLVAEGQTKAELAGLILQAVRKDI